MPVEHPSDNPKSTTDNEQIEVVKYNLLTQWMYLPVEHQAETLLILLRHTLATQTPMPAKTEVASIPELLARMQGEESTDFDAPFEITSVSREDLMDFLSTDDIAVFSNADMRKLAGKLADAYTGSGVFWDDLKLFARMMLKEKQAADEDDERGLL